MRSIRALLIPLLLCAVGCGASSVTAPALPSNGQTASYPAASGPYIVGRDAVRVLPRGTTAFPVIRSLLETARRSVEVEMYELQRRDLLDALIAAQARGVRVIVITDPTVGVSTVSAEALRAAGVDVVLYPVRKQMIDHVKLLVVDDGRVGVVGGINWGNASAPNHDIDLVVRGPASLNLHRVFVRDLVTCGRLTTVPAEVADPAVEVLVTLPTAAIRPPVVEAIEDARSTIDLELYVITDLGVVHAIERAFARGVRIRIVLDPTQRPSDAPAAELRSRGVDVRLYRGRGELLHAKTMVVDGRTVVAGSANWSAGGFARNHELDVVLPDAPDVAAVLTQAEDSDWGSASVGAGVPGAGQGPNEDA